MVVKGSKDDGGWEWEQPDLFLLPSLAYPSPPQTMLVRATLQLSRTCARPASQRLPLLRQTTPARFTGRCSSKPFFLSPIQSHLRRLLQLDASWQQQQESMSRRERTTTGKSSGTLLSRLRIIPNWLSLTVNLSRISMLVVGIWCKQEIESSRSKT